MSSRSTHECIFDLGHFRPGRTERPDPPRGARGSAARFSADHRRPVALLYAEAPHGMVSVLPDTARHRVRSAQGTTASLHTVTTRSGSEGSWPKV